MLQQGDSDNSKEELKMIESWCETNCMIVNEKKTYEMIITNTRDQAELPSSYIHGKVIKRVDSIKVLGLTLSNNLKWEVEVDNKLRKAKQLTYALRHLSFTHSIGDIKQLFESVLVPSVFYCCQAWCNLTDSDIDQLQRICNRAGYFANSHLDFRTHLLKNVLDLFVKAHDPMHPLHYMTISCRRSSNVASRRPRLLSERAKSTRYFKSFLPTAIRLYNES